MATEAKVASDNLVLIVSRYRLLTEGRHFREPAAGCISDDFQQLLDAPAPDGGDDTEFGKMRADRINDGSLLTDEEMARPVEHETAVARLSWSARAACWAS